MKSVEQATIAKTAQIDVHQLDTPGTEIRTSRNAEIPASNAFRIVSPLSPPANHDRLTR